jgi:pimeloyl-ACP methyl ester carboxylesterase
LWHSFFPEEARFWFEMRMPTGLRWLLVQSAACLSCLPLARGWANHLPPSHARPAAAGLLHREPRSRRRLRGAMPPRCRAEAASTIQTFTFSAGGGQEFECAFRRLPARSGREGDPPLLLVHPVGIGLSSWFWDKLLKEWKGGEVFAADLIGCGDSEPWVPGEKGMFVPLDWVRSLEALWAQEIGRPCVVVCQGGLGPLAVQIAARSRADVAGLVLASPPNFDDMRAGLDQKKVESNWMWLTSPPGQLSYYLLRLRAFVEFFSNLFLFAGGAADEEWLEAACKGATPDARYPVFAFNSGLVIAKGYEDELQLLSRRSLPILVLSGAEDGRTQKREAAARSLDSCRLLTLAGKNVLPWENPRETAAALLEFSTSLR